MKPYFIGTVKTEWLPDGRLERLLEPYVFVDADGVRWTAPAGALTDGASVPRLLWWLFDPYCGKYREAAVVHDEYCRNKTRAWWRVHWMFYVAARCAGAPRLEASLMYLGILVGGPKWRTR
jgi:Protein of unknown function (DUF1353)